MSFSFKFHVKLCLYLPGDSNLTGIASLILAKVELFFVNFKSISNIERSYMSGSHMTYCLHGLFCQVFPLS